MVLQQLNNDYTYANIEKMRANLNLNLTQEIDDIQQCLQTAMDTLLTCVPTKPPTPTRRYQALPPQEASEAAERFIHETEGYPSCAPGRPRAPLPPDHRYSTASKERRAAPQNSDEHRSEGEARATLQLKEATTAVKQLETADERQRTKRGMASNTRWQLAQKRHIV